MINVFIDGDSGTTGLKIHKRLRQRDDISLILLDDDKKKDKSSKYDAINNSDVTFLCLPDHAARESVSLVKNDKTIIIDASTAHRTDTDWTYGFIEADKYSHEKIASSKRISNPGCHAIGFIALVRPLVDAGIIDADYPLSCTSLTGYSGGGKSMIQKYQDKNRDLSLTVPNMYALTQNHKHLCEMKMHSKIDYLPAFTPFVCDIYSMMCVNVNIVAPKKGIEYIKEVYIEHYFDKPLIDVSDIRGDLHKGVIVSDHMSGLDSMKITVTGNDDRIMLTALYDNLGKGASGNALQCLNILTGKNQAYNLYTKQEEKRHE